MSYLEAIAAACSALAAVAALVTAHRSLTAAKRSAHAAERSADTADRAARTAEAAAATAETVARIERARWHADLRPDLTLRIVGDRDPKLVVRFTGPVNLFRLERVVLEIRDFRRREPSGLAGTPTAEEIAEVIWGPLRFKPFIDGSSPDGRRAKPFGLELEEDRLVGLAPTLEPNWYEHRRWVQERRREPLRLWVTCEAAGHRPWTWTVDIELDYDILNSLG